MTDRTDFTHADNPLTDGMPGVVAGLAQSAVIMGPLFGGVAMNTLYGAKTPLTALTTGAGMTLALVALSALGTVGMLGLGALDTPHRVHHLSTQVLERIGVEPSSSQALTTFAAWAAALPGSLIGGLVASALWWLSFALCLVLMLHFGYPAPSGRVVEGWIADLMLGATLALGVVPLAFSTRTAYLLARSFTAGRSAESGPGKAGFELGVTLLGGLVGFAATLLAFLPLMVLFGGAAVFAGALKSGTI